MNVSAYHVYIRTHWMHQVSVGDPQFRSESDSDTHPVNGMNDDMIGEKERRTLLVACCTAAFITPLLSTMANLSLVSIGDEFEQGSHSLGYVNTMFLLSSVIFMVPLAKVGDMIGRRRMFIVGIAITLLGCIIAAISPMYSALLLSRIVMGAGAAAISCTSMSLITDAFPREMRGGAIGLQTMCVYIGLAIGPPLGGLLNDILGWRSLFLIVLPIGILAMFLVSRCPFEIAPDNGGTFDRWGAVLYAVAITFTMMGVINVPEAWAFVSILAGLVFLILFVRSQTVSVSRLLNVGLFRNRMFTGSCLATFMSYVASYSLSFFLALYLQSIGAMSASEAGALMLVQPAIQAVGTPVFGRLSDHMSDKRILPTAGMVLIAAGLAVFMTLGLDMSIYRVIVAMVVVGFGYSMFSAPNTSVIMSSVGPRETGEASAVVSVMRQTGMMVSMGIAMCFISVMMGSTDNLAPDTFGLFVEVMDTTFVTCMVLCVVGAVLSMMRGKAQSADA